MLFGVGIEPGMHLGVRGSPGAFESPTFVDPFGGEGAELEVGIGAFETIGVVALGLELFAGEGRQRLAVVDIVGEGGIGIRFETTGQNGVEAFEHLGRDAHHAEGVTLGFGVFKQIEEYGGVVLTVLVVTIGFGTQGREIGGATFETEAHHQQAAVNGDLRAVDETPRHEVHEIEIAIAGRAVQGVAQHEIAIGIVYVSKFNHGQRNGKQPDKGAGRERGDYKGKARRSGPCSVLTNKAMLSKRSREDSI